MMTQAENIFVAGVAIARTEASTIKNSTIRESYSCGINQVIVGFLRANGENSREFIDWVDEQLKSFGWNKSNA